jgi:hypothetical protein
MTRQTTKKIVVRTTAISLAATLALWPVSGVAQQAAPTAQVDIATTRVGTAQHLMRLAGNKHFIFIGETEALLIDPNTLGIERRIAFDSVEWAARQGGEGEQPILLKSQNDKQHVINPSTGEQLPLAQGDDILFITGANPGSVVVTQPKDATRIIVTRIGQLDPIAILEKPASATTGKDPKISLSNNGRHLALVWSGTVRLVDLSDGRVRAVSAEPNSATVVHTTFTSNDTALVLVTESGPFDVRTMTTLQTAGRITVPTMNRRFSATSHRSGSIIAVDGRRQRAVFDTKSGKHITAERLSSGSGFLLRYVEPDLVLRASSYRMGKGSAYGLYRHERGDFKLLFRAVADGLVLSALTLSPNSKCLFVVAKTGAKIVDTASNRPLTTATEAAAVTHAQFTEAGDAIIATDEAGKLLRVTTPESCRVSAADKR